jgi:hypothetical protein
MGKGALLLSYDGALVARRGRIRTGVIPVYSGNPCLAARTDGRVGTATTYGDRTPDDESARGTFRFQR